MMKWLSVVQAADYLGVSKETIYRLVYSKKVKHYKIGKLIRFKTSDLDKTMKVQK